MQQSDFGLRRADLFGQYRLLIKPMYEKYQAEFAKNKHNESRAYQTFRAEIKSHLEEVFSQIELAKKEMVLMKNWRWGKTNNRGLKCFGKLKNRKTYQTQ